jgi:hypothetical protein
MSKTPKTPAELEALAAALLGSDGLARVQAELRALKHERRALRRMESLILTASGAAREEDADHEDDEEDVAADD